MSLSFPIQYVIWIVVGLLWAIQMFMLFLIYHRVVREAKGRGLSLITKKAPAPSATPDEEAPTTAKKTKKELKAEKAAQKAAEKAAKKEAKKAKEEASPIEEVPSIQQQAIEQPIEEAPIIEKTAIEEVPIEQSTSEETIVDEATNIEEATIQPSIEEAPIEQSIIEEPVIEEAVIKESFIEEPVVEEVPIQTIIEETPASSESSKEQSAPVEPSAPVASNMEQGDLFAAFEEEVPVEAQPTPNEESPAVDEEGFFGDLFGQPIPRKQPTTGKKRNMSEDARQGIIDELVISEEELREDPGIDPFSVLFTDDPDDAPTPERPDAPMLSVVVVACNQDTHLRQNLPALLEQDYPNYEVIVIDDNSNDDTADVLQYLQTRYPHLQTRVTPASARRISHRKLSLMLGIKASQGEWLVFTEADCRPLSAHWLSSMARQLPSVADPLTSDVDAVIGYTAYAPGKGVGAWIRRYDNMLRNARLLGLALGGHAPMAYCSNMLYRRELFFESKGYGAHLDLERGEDDIFVNENIAPRRIRAEIDGKAVVLCTDNDAHRRTIERLGRIATGRKLRGLMPHILRADTFTRGLYAYTTLAAIILAAIAQAWITLAIVVVLWGTRYALQWIVLRRLQTLFGEADYAPWTPLYELAHPIWEIRLHLLYLFTPVSTWHRKTI